MADSTSFVGSIPEFYDRGMGPVMFEPYAREIAARDAATQLVATDLSPSRLEYAERHVGPLPNTQWQLADLTALPFADGTFDAVACRFGVMFPPDKPGIFREVRRVLKPRGHWIFNVWDALEANPHAAAIDRTVAAMCPGDRPRFFRLPYSSADREVLARHDFTDIALDTVPKIARSVTARALASGMAQGSPLVTGLIERGFDLAEVVDRVTAALAALGGAAPFECPMQAVVCPARAG